MKGLFVRVHANLIHRLLGQELTQGKNLLFGCILSQMYIKDAQFYSNLMLKFSYIFIQYQPHDYHTGLVLGYIRLLSFEFVCISRILKFVRFTN